MGVKEESNLQGRIQKLIKRRGGYVKKNWGNMTSEPGVADLTFCYKGLYIALEVKVDENKPTKAQGIHARMVQKAGGITAVVWDLEDVEDILLIIDGYLELALNTLTTIDHIKKKMKTRQIDDGTRY